MLKRARIAFRYLEYVLASSNGRGHGIHSPFVFDFVQNVLNDKKPYPEYAVIEKLRKKLQADHSPVPFEDFGAGSSVSPSGIRTISSIACGSAKPPKYAQLLFRCIKHYTPHYIVELGTSLGISSAYLAAGDPQSVLLTAEGNYAVAALAKKHLDGLGLSNARVFTGQFDNTLPQMLGSLPAVDFAFIDGNHRKEPTLNYFNQLLAKLSTVSAIVFDDIHWSKEMEETWENIKNHPQVMLSVDVFFMGIIFFRPEFRVKQHFVIQF